MPATRVVITGMGWVTPLGCDIDGVWRALLEGRSGVGRVSRFDAATFRTNFAAEVKGFRLEDFLGDDAPRHLSANLTSRFALAAAQRAVEQAGLGGTSVERRRFGVYLGAGEGWVDHAKFFPPHVGSWDRDNRRLDAAKWRQLAGRWMDPAGEVEQEPNAPLVHLARRFGCRGPSRNCMTACAAGTQAVGEAFELLRHGDADVMLAGGTHSMIHPLGMTGFIRLTAMSSRRAEMERAARPFSRTRDGFVMGEGAGVIVLETLDHAAWRGAEPLAEIVGYGSSADAYRITDMHPDGEGPAEAIALAMKQAGINPREPDGRGRPPVQYVSAHGTGTAENDLIETKAIKRVFGPMAPRLAISSIKSMMGHLIQAAGVVELMTCVMAIKTGWAPPTINLDDADPECDLDYIPNAARNLADRGGIDVAISNGFGFGGQNDSVVVRRWVG